MASLMDRNAGILLGVVSEERGLEDGVQSLSLLPGLTTKINMNMNSPVLPNIEASYRRAAVLQG